MEMGNILKYALFLSALSFVFSQSSLRCYDCDPLHHHEECQEPIRKDAPDQICNEPPKNSNVNNDIENNQNVTYTCLSSYIKSVFPNKTGVFRGCYALRKPEIQDVCDLFIEETSSKNASVVSCHACNTTRCNTVRLFADGSSGTHSNLLSVMIFNIVFGIIISLSI
ncbi:uncharacterized protein [Leptinotarsa decemlineata]|uniref:uncharacterized protein n=1 Tax=Leptinotarsa decemlineata TaxID=7539 RepID=UPI003D304187